MGLSWRCPLHARDRGENKTARLLIQCPVDTEILRDMDIPQRLPMLHPAATFHALQEWEGYVLEIGETDFVARLVDLTAGSVQEEEEAVIPLGELSDEDAAKMRPGSIFRWVIGYERTVAGSKRRVSQIVFRDLSAITRKDLRDGERWALETIRSLGL